MSMNVEPCDIENLRQSLEASAPQTLVTAVVRHLESCDACRAQLENLAADDAWWQDSRQSLGGLHPFAPTLWDYETRAENSSAGDERTGRADEASDARGLSLTFLEPSDNPAMLGRLGEFEILEPIGVGGMGIVLKGYDHELNRFVAVKVLHPHCATSAAARKRFVREAQAAAAVVHPHVIAIHAVDAGRQPPFLVMPFVPGESLQQRLDRDGAFPVIDVLRIGQQIASGLAAAHAQGLVHRDIKPANVLLERNVDRVLLTDFGLARAADDASLTRSGVIAGTPQYMAPEQARGEAIDARADLFSLGSLLYTLLAGYPPFRAETSLGILRRVTDETPRALREINPEVPEWLEAIIAKLHAKRPEDRPPSSEQLAELLRASLAHAQHPTQFRLPAEVQRWTRQLATVRRSGRRRLNKFALVLASVTASLGVLSVAWYFYPWDQMAGIEGRITQDRSPVISKSSPSLPAAPSTNQPSAAESVSSPWGLWNDGFDREWSRLRDAIEELESSQETKDEPN
ncbi:MAG: serine/threonine-protein kinase [Pirellulales bacterium]